PYVDLDAQPPLSYHLINIHHYRRHLFGVDHVSFNSSRGCTFRCAFCWDPVLHGRKWRAMQPSTVMEQVRRIIRDYGIRGFLFTDDFFFVDMNRARGILEEVVRSGLGISISKLQARADTVCRMDREFTELLVRANVRRLTIGVESGSQEMLDFIKKDTTVEQVLEANQKLKPYPIVPVYLFMMALPGETPEQFEKSVRLAIRLTDENPRAVKTFNIYTPYPGTELFQVAVQMGLQPPERLEDWAAFNFRNVYGDALWVHPRTRQLAEGLDFPLMFLGKGHFVTPYKKTNPLVVALARMYYPLARYRVRQLDVRWPIETKLAKRLGLFGRQD
ncbi:MAG: B12-binding domain-containing radical SAM protein, partial [Verrucomicrobiae bacterium]|nr:B12-binding domain-containing radical SAM protein [Verrucomicrobiae bacterium]